MDDKQIIKYKDSIFSRIKDKLLNLFKKEEMPHPVIIQEKEPDDKRNGFIDELVVDGTKKQRLLQIRNEYENNRITEKQISESDKIELTKIYKEETENINREIEKTRRNISKMMELLKKQQLKT